jgi:hypothetical protein
MPAQLQYRRDTAANFILYQPYLLTGEIAYETDTGKFKIGYQGVAWGSLPYYNNLTPLPNYQNTIVYAVASGTWSLPASVQATGSVFKVTLIGAGGSGGGTPATAGHVGNGGGSGAAIIATYTYVAGITSMSYTVGTGGAAAGTNAAGNAGTATTTTYNGVTYTANGGSGGATSATVNGGGAGGTFSGVPANQVNISGFKGDTGGVNTATMSYVGKGADTPLGYGAGGVHSGAAGNGQGATNYGSGGSGGTNSATATARAGGAGAGGLLVIQY